MCDYVAAGVAFFLLKNRPDICGSPISLTTFPQAFFVLRKMDPGTLEAEGDSFICKKRKVLKETTL